MSASKIITVKFFALLREPAGCREAALDTAASTPAALHTELMPTRGLTVPPGILAFAVNGRYVPAGDRVAFIPPVAGD